MSRSDYSSDPLAQIGERAFWPTVLFAEDLALIFGIGLSAARKRLARGDFGPRFRSGRRWAVLKLSLIGHLESLQGRGAELAQLLRIDEVAITRNRAGSRERAPGRDADEGEGES